MKARLAFTISDSGAVSDRAAVEAVIGPLETVRLILHVVREADEWFFVRPNTVARLRRQFRVRWWPEIRRRYRVWRSERRR